MEGVCPRGEKGEGCDCPGPAKDLTMKANSPRRGWTITSHLRKWVQ